MKNNEMEQGNNRSKLTPNNKSRPEYSPGEKFPGHLYALLHPALPLMINVLMRLDSREWMGRDL
jgi:hypothetical protein